MFENLSCPDHYHLSFGREISGFLSSAPAWKPHFPQFSCAFRICSDVDYRWALPCARRENDDPIRVVPCSVLAPNTPSAETGIQQPALVESPEAEAAQLARERTGWPAAGGRPAASAATNTPAFPQPPLQGRALPQPEGPPGCRGASYRDRGRAYAACGVGHWRRRSGGGTRLEPRPRPQP